MKQTERRTRLRPSNVVGRQQSNNGRSTTNNNTRAPPTRMISYTTGSTLLLQLLSSWKYLMTIIFVIFFTIFVVYQKDIIMNQLIWSNKSLEPINKRRNPPLTAIIHVGPLKTGSSSIQETLMSFRQRNILKKDDYIYGNYYFSKDAENFIDNARRFSDCFVKDHSVYGFDPKNYCNETVVQYISNISVIHNSNMIISSEWLSGDGIQLQLLYNFLSLYWDDIYIIMYYRRFYDWMLSFHNQGQKYRKVKDRKSILHVTKFITEQHDSFFEKQYIGSLYKRYNKYFHNNHNNSIVNSYINVINMHSYNNDVRESFFCNHIIPHSNNMCTEYHEDIITKKSSSDENRKESLIYEEIAYYAKLDNIINYTELNQPNDINLYTSTETINKIQLYHESIIINKTNDHDGFPIESISCLSDVEYKILYDKSLKYEKLMGLNDTNNEFQIMFEQLKSKFCHINASIIIQDITWNTFLQSISKKE